MGIRVSHIMYVRDRRFKFRMVSVSDSAVCHVKWFRQNCLQIAGVLGVPSQWQYWVCQVRWVK